ncbi:glycosyltransferase family 2 protein [Sulfuricurvum sp.]|uniref:glycosyltransferase family 2 protein n=1 Tax=Sulfuricurvum sp. TaxID=2025608 RepID=UPI0035671E33
MHISIITVNYNSSHHTINMVESIRKMTASSLTYEIIIVDNASEPEQYDLLLSLQSFSDITIIRSRINGGFAWGNMLGVQHAMGDYYLFLNNDTLFQNDVLTLFYNYAQTNKDVGLLGGHLSNKDGSRTSSYKKFPSLLSNLLGNSLARLLTPQDFPSNKTVLNVPTEVSVVSGSCMFFRRDCFDKIGGFDTVFFLYCEEEDISKRVWDSGLKVMYLPDAHILHLEGASTTRNLAIEKEFYISYILLLNKHFPLWKVAMLKSLQLIKLLRRSFRSTHYFCLFLFVLRGAPIKESLRYKQSIKI